MDHKVFTAFHSQVAVEMGIALASNDYN